MSAIIFEERVRIPAWVKDHASFRRWARSEEFPEYGRFSHLRGEVWVDLSMERVIHNQLKGAIAVVVGGLVMTKRLGHFFHDGLLLTHVGAELSTEPDGMFVSREALRSGRVQIDEGEAATEVLGAPDMVLEVVSPSSVQKDTLVLRDLYWEAGVAEYWLVDSRAERPTIELLRHGRKAYTAARRQGGWVKSGVFGKSFQLTQEKDQSGLPEYRLLVR
jgi:Uma2 family endonuclease